MKTYPKLSAAVCTALVVFNFSQCKDPETPTPPKPTTPPDNTNLLLGTWELTEMDGQAPDGELLMEFEKDGDGTYTYSYYGYTYNYGFSWEWGTDQKTIEVDMSFITYEYDVIKITKDEMEWKDEADSEMKFEKQ